MSKFIITREWLAEALSLADRAAEVRFTGDEAKAVLRAAWKGMGYPTDRPTEVFDFVPAENPNWLKYNREHRPQDRRTDKSKPIFRVITANTDEGGSGS
jgi:hypothetical protein